MAVRKTTKKDTKSSKTAKKTSSRAKKAVSKKTQPKSSPVHAKQVESPNSRWWEKYSYTNTEIIQRVVLLVLISFLAIRFKGAAVAALVNGEPISRLAVVNELEKQGGKETLEGLINETLIKQKARESFVDVTQEDINARIADIEASIAGQSLDDLLALQGMTRAQLEEQLQIQVMVEKLLEGDITVSDEEIENYKTENSEFLPQGVEGQALNDQVRDQIKQEKLANRFSTWIQELRSEADINYWVTY